MRLSQEQINALALKCLQGEDLDSKEIRRSLGIEFKLNYKERDVVLADFEKLSTSLVSSWPPTERNVHDTAVCFDS